MMTNSHTPSSSMYLFGIDLSKHSRLAQFLLTSTAVLVFHVAQGYIQELILQLKPLRTYPNYFTLVQFICFTVLAYTERRPTYGYGLIFSVVGYLGIDIVLTLIKEYGALICVTVTTCRKAITIILSFTLFSKPFVFDYIWSGVIVIVGIYLNVYSRNQTVFNAKIVSLAHYLFNPRWWPNILTPSTSQTLPL
ncbi:unnamed protein product [Adineta steineri]|uniref:Adenosine 3'-phospho 5'-phosphosulfate transporter 2 n=1 Tax=Adineta steineri TaxID=433720 RepID=A0A813UGJ3_9BILA|nr:unnamed protein product [Adineta steineri]